MTKIIIKTNKGFIAIFATILVLITGLIIITGVASIVFSNIQAMRNNIYSAKAYYVAEAGIEDTLLRLVKGMNLPSSNSLTIEGGTATIEISESIGGSRTIISKGDLLNRIRKIRVIYIITTDHVSFYYGAQVGDGGMMMENNSRIKGNVFSNGSIVGVGGKGYIDYSAKVATIGNRIEGLIIGQDAYTHNCKDSDIAGILYFSGGGQENCNATQGIKDHPVQETASLPISDEQIDKWKSDALGGGIFSNNYVVSGGAIDYLGPRKIEGNLTLQNNSTLILTGTVWVTGNIILNNESMLKLDNRYGYASGLIIADGKIDVINGTNIQGSGQEGSYTMLIGTSSLLDPSNPAIDVKNNAEGAIFFASHGLIRLRNNMLVREVTGYKLYLDNNAIVEYETGLEDVGFSSGPGGSWKLSGWQEIE